MQAATALELAKGRVADLCWNIHPGTARQLCDKVYSDDGALAASSREELLEMRGERQEDGRYTGYVAQILNTCGMSAKFIAIAGEAGQEEEKQLGGAMLGVGYHCPSDKITFSFPPVYHRKGRGGIKEEVLIGKEELKRLQLGSGTFTLRIALSYVMG